MKFILTKKDILAMNQQFDMGNFSNEASLDFALSYAHKTGNWTKALAYLVRAVLLDHVFEEGNKRTAALLIKTVVELEGHRVLDEKVALLIKNVIFKNVANILQIEEMIKNVIV